MKRVIGIALAATITSATLVNAEAIDFRSVKCQEVAALPEDTLDLVAVWLDGFSADEEDAESMKVDFSGTDADEIKVYCQQHPAMGLLQATEEMDK